jgi:hypothetical protein
MDFGSWVQYQDRDDTSEEIGMCLLRRIWAQALVCGLAAAVFSCTCAPAYGDDREDEIERLRLLVSEVQPAVAELIGMPEGEPVKVAVKTRKEIREYVIQAAEMGYPDDELYRRGRCLAEIGLLPEDFDLKSGMIDLVGEQAGGLYDPYGKAFTGIIDLPPGLKATRYQKLIASHELTHALEDRVVDILEEAKTGLTNLDYEYAFRSIIEGIATVVMIAYTQDLALDGIPDTRAIMRTSFERKAGDPTMKALAGSPPYLKELLISPYAEGGAFVQAWHRANPDMDLAALMTKVPPSSEQVLHPEKYFEPDEPTVIDLHGIERALPEEWDSFYTNTLGEFDLLTLFSLHEQTSADAGDIASGWDGLRFRAFHHQSGQLVLLGSSVWDSEKDAEEFHAGFSAVLAGISGPGSYALVRNGVYVDFVIGPVEDPIRESLLAAVSEAR